MAAIQVRILPTSYTLPTPSGSKLSLPKPARLLQTGPAYLNHAKLLLHHGASFHAQDNHEEKERQRLQLLQNAGTGSLEDDLDVGDESETEDLLALDPKEWKKQDHYAVLGLSKFRYKATNEQIKIAHRKKVLKHHPDKKVSTTTTETTSSLLTGINLNTNDDAFFKCIQKAHEVLTNPERRRQFDSVDPQFLEEYGNVPTASQIKSGKVDFFEGFAPVFEREARFSKQDNPPLLGGPDASKEHVEGFYDFWYNFDSWRSFEYLDKEVNEGSDSRDDKRYTEKKNKSERARRKKEDTARLRGIVDLALNIDPRIKRIKEEEKQARQAKKAAKSTTNSGANTPSKAKIEEEEAKRKKEEEEQAARAEAKKAKAAAANAAKKARRAARAAEGS